MHDRNPPPPPDADASPEPPPPASAPGAMSAERTAGLRTALDKLAVEYRAQVRAMLAPFTVASWTCEPPTAEQLAEHDRAEAARAPKTGTPPPTRPADPDPLPPVEMIANLPRKGLPGFVVRLAALTTAAGARLACEAEVASPLPVDAGAQHVMQVEAATLSGVPLHVVRFLTRTGRVPSLKRGRHRLLLPADLHRYLAECREKGVAVGAIRQVSSPRERRRGPRGAQAAGADTSPVRRAGRRGT